MCGIAGVLQKDKSQVNRDVLRRMRDRLQPRGPDAEGEYFDDGIALGFRRLSILDLSPLGNQPMRSPDGNFVIVFNGEIYNFIELRETLRRQGYEFQSETDTEVVLAAYQAYGVDCVRQFNGMWGFAIWDRNKRRLFCSRDRFGVKPFYYYEDKHCFVFASEIKSVLEHPAVGRRENRQKVYEYVVLGQQDRGRETLFDGIYALPGGHSLLLDDAGMQIVPHWVPDGRVSEALSFDSAVEKYRETLIDAVRIRLRSDVPQGLLLSGGQDSSAIAGIIAYLTRSHTLDARGHLKTARLQTFSACYEDPKLNERPYIDAVLTNFDLDGNVLYPTPADIVDQFEGILQANDEPLITSNALAHGVLLARVRNNGIKVLLSGQGADEVLAGYDRHVFGPLVADHLGAFRIKRLVEECRAFHQTTGLSHRFLLGQAVQASLKGLIDTQALKVRAYSGLSEYLEPGVMASFGAKTSGSSSISASRLKQQLMDNMTSATLPSIVHYEDRGSMHYSVEERFPFLDYRLVEFSLSLPDSYLVESGVTKRILRAAVSDFLPTEVRHRTSKLGFATPTREWLNRLRETASGRSALEEAARGTWLLSPIAQKALQNNTYGDRQAQFMWRVFNYCYWRQTYKIE